MSARCGEWILTCTRGSCWCCWAPPGEAAEVVVPESLVPVWVHVSDAVGAPKDVEVGFAIDGAGERQCRSLAGVVALRQTHAPCRLMVEGRTVLKLGAGLVSPIELFIQA
jgi:hypothetical protein